MVMCWAPDCKHYNVREKCKFFTFPKAINERKRWIRLLRRTVEPGPGAVVCSCHFRDGIKSNGPEIFAHNVSKRAHFLITSPEKRKKKKSSSKKQSNSPSATGATQLSQVSILSTSLSPHRKETGDMVPSTSTGHVIPLNLTEFDTHTSDILVIQDEDTSTSKKSLEATVQVTPTKSKTEIESTNPPTKLFETSAALGAENYFLKQEVENLKDTLTYMRERFCYENIKENDKLVVLYTGLPNSKIFEALYDLLKNVEIRYYLGWNVTSLQKVDQLLLALMKLRLNSPHLDLAQRFRISSAAVTNVILTFFHLLYECLYEQLMKNIPSRQKNVTCLPSCFSKFTNCRIVLDCTEIFTVVSRKSMKTQRLTYSSYKHHNTYKGLVGVAPNGVITYLSDLYVGSTSDQKIVLDSGILKHLEMGDLILADKGFLIQDILPHGVSLNIPPFLRTPQFTEEQVRRTESIARARIHIERAIRRMKCFRILTFIPESLCAYGDIIFKIVGALTNLQYPLIKEVEELFSND